MTPDPLLSADPVLLADQAEAALASGDRFTAAALYDRAYGLAPREPRVVFARQRLLNALAVDEYGLQFRYVPAGSRVIGSADGDPDERPVHPVTLHGFWLTDTPVSWADYCTILGWSAPPHAAPDDSTYGPHIVNLIRAQYCEDELTWGGLWYAHEGPAVTGVHRELPGTYGAKPIVAVGWQDAAEVAAAMYTPGFAYRLPTEAEWEVAARGALVGARYPWGNAPPTVDVCDVGRFDDFAITAPRSLPPNGYGLYGMCGGVWEWTADWYDSLYYAQSPVDNPTGPAQGREKVVRGGSWADCPEVATVSFRSSHGSSAWRDDGGPRSPTLGFRLCRVASP